MRIRQGSRRSATGLHHAGFTLLEMILACAVLMVGVAAVVQLVPASLKTSVNNRLDTMATAVAQRELDQMLSQPLTATAFTDSDGNAISLGGVGAPGANVVMDGPSAAIDFSSDPSSVPAGFSSLYVDLNDPNDPNRVTFELRWAVFIQKSGAKVIGRRIIIGCRRANSNTGVFPVTLDSMQNF